MEVSGHLHAPAAWERNSGTHWVGPRAGLDTVVKRKILWSDQEPNPGRPARKPESTFTEHILNRDLGIGRQSISVTRLRIVGSY
jgi:hypothetical protein